MTPLSRLRAVQVAGLLALFAAAWSALLAATRLSPPTDTLEQWVWAHALAWGYFKHPPLPTWILWAVSRAAGLREAVVTMLGAATTAGTFLLLWLMLRRWRGAVHASVATLAALCITFYNGRLDYFNHEIVMLPLVAGCAWALERALATRRLAAWLGVGACLGAGLLAKYQMAVVGLCVLAVVVRQRAWRDPASRRGMGAALGVLWLLVLPHAAWLLMQDDGPIQYALGSSLGLHLSSLQRLLQSLHFLADQVLNRALPAWLVLGAVAWSLRHGGVAEAAAPATNDLRRTVLVTWGVLPLAFMVLLGLLTGADLQLHWGTPFLLFLVPAVMELLPGVPWRRTRAAVLWVAFGAMQALVATLCVLQSPLGPPALRDAHWRQFDSARLAAVVGPAARAALGGPVRLVIGPETLAGALALRLPEHPLVLIDGIAGRSPWVPPGLLAQCGAVRLRVDPRVPQGVPKGMAPEAVPWDVVPPEPGAPPCGGAAP